MDPVALSPQILAPGQLDFKPGQLRGSEEEKLATLASQFEAAMIRQFLEEGLRPMFETPLTPDDARSGIYRYMVTEVVSQQVVANKNFGIASLLQMQLSQSLPDDPDAVAVPVPASPGVTTSQVTRTYVENSGKVD